jgi:hypothetical protein
VDFKVADTTVSGVRLSVLPLAPVEVLIHRLFTAKRNDQQISEADPGLQLELTPVERNLESFGGGVALRHSEEEAPGHFEAMGIVPGRYWINVAWVQGGYISAISSGTTDLTREPLVIGSGNSVPPIEVTIRNDGGTIDCTVNNPPNADMRNAGAISGRFSNGPTVYVIPTGPRLSGFPQAQIWGPGGNAHFENLAPGLYRVVALSKFKDLNTADPTELAKLIAQGKSVTVEAGGTTSVRVDFENPDAEEPTP